MLTPSPCIGICEISPTTGLCRGCLRRLDEIAAWSSMTEHQRLEVLMLITQRRSSEDQPPS